MIEMNALLDGIDRELASVDARLAATYPGKPGTRQPVPTPVIALATKGRYYLKRPDLQPEPRFTPTARRRAPPCRAARAV